MTPTEQIAALTEALRKIADGNPTCDNPEADAQNSASIASATLAAVQAPAEVEPVAVTVKPLHFEWFKDADSPNQTTWRCKGDGYFAYVLIPYDLGNNPAIGAGKWNANPNHRGRMGFDTREAAMAYCEETIRRQAASEVKDAIAKLAMWSDPATPAAPTVQDAARVPEIAALIEAAKHHAETLERHGLSGGPVADIRSALHAITQNGETKMTTDQAMIWNSAIDAALQAYKQGYGGIAQLKKRFVVIVEHVGTTTKQDVQVEE